MAAPDVFTGTVVGTVDLPGGGLTSSWRKILVENRDSVNSFGVQINNEPTPWTLDPGTRHGDSYGNGPGITRVRLINQGGAPAYQIKLHY
jgi:hypothetical protein